MLPMSLMLPYTIWLEIWCIHDLTYVPHVAYTNLLKIVSVKPKHQNTSMTCFSCARVGLCPVCSVTRA